MKWKDAKGQTWEFTREKARQMDREQGREHIPRPVVESIIAIGAAKAVLKAHKDQVKKWAQKSGAWRMLAPTVGLLDAALDKMVGHGFVEQVCAIQHSTENVWVNVTNTKGSEKLNVEQADLACLMHAARGGIRDNDGQCCDCYRCTAWSSRIEWQQCELYSIINSIPCDVEEQVQLLPDVCPYALNRDGEEMEL